MLWLPGYSRSTPSIALSRAQEKLAASDSFGSGSVLPTSANTYALPWDWGVGCVTWIGCGACTKTPGGGGPVRTDPGARLGSTSCTARDRAAYQEPSGVNAVTGSVLPPPVLLEMAYTVGAPKKRAWVSRPPRSGVRNGSSSVSGSAIATPPMPWFMDG